MQFLKSTFSAQDVFTKRMGNQGHPKVLVSPDFTTSMLLPGDGVVPAALAYVGNITANIAAAHGRANTTSHLSSFIFTTDGARPARLKEVENGIIHFCRYIYCSVCFFGVLLQSGGAL